MVELSPYCVPNCLGDAYFLSRLQGRIDHRYRFPMVKSVYFCPVFDADDFHFFFINKGLKFRSEASHANHNHPNAEC